ncbi:PIN domain-containing protein [Salipiger abyssi]|uniref:Putative nucleic-acid-binding protein, contains PIN domain n=1 Tax=Salipiger abyssi TaxID=1250539 RepID=A0A1P8UM02_9RHOB|nr:PIN domain-containing protein [Salipiger abyssi]APZ50434.1 putative nucleic-acid-binding protein, contains PIN domain [Salipiger abyssi]
MSDEFFDTNIILYLLSDGPKADIAERLLARGGTISVQVLNEALVNCRRKAGMSWDEAGAFLSAIRGLCEVIPLTEDIHDVGRALSERYGFSVYDGMIVGAALSSGCTLLWSEDMHNGLLVEGRLRIRNPFAEL